MEFVALALAVPDVVEKIIKLGKDVAARVRAVKDPRTMMGDLSIFDRELLLRAQFEAGRIYCENNDMDPEIQLKLNDKFIDIQKLLHEAQGYVSEVEKFSKSKRFWLKDEPRKILAKNSTKLQTSLGDFTDVIQLIHIKRSQPSHLLLSDTDFQWIFTSDRQAIGPGCYLLEGDLVSKRNGIEPKHGFFVCEKHPYSSSGKPAVENNLRLLSEKLSSLPSQPGTLVLVGLKDNIADGCFDLVFDLPNNIMIEQTLADVLHSQKPTPSLNIRISLCQQMASAIFQVHSVKMVHKRVRSQNALFFSDGEDKIGSDCRVFLMDWHMLRKADAATQRLPEQDPLLGVYQHPSRQGITVEERYNMSHDIYSLGVSMLEILLWIPLVTVKSGERTRLSKRFISELSILGTKPQDIMIENQSSVGGYESVRLVLSMSDR